MEEGSILQLKREQLLRLVARGFHRELLKYGVEPPEVLAVATHLLDSLMSDEVPPDSRLLGDSFRVSSVQDDWQSARLLHVGGVSLRPFDESDVPVLASARAQGRDERLPGVRRSRRFPDRDDA